MFTPKIGEDVRKAELGLDKPKKELTIEANSTVTVKDKSQELSCSTSTDLHLQEALTRRALALDLVGIASFARVEEYTRFLMSQLQNDAPPGYSKTSIQQVLRADKEAWLRLAEKLKDGVKRRPDGVLPLDDELRGLQSDPKVVFHLLPLPHTAVETHHISGDGGDDSWFSDGLKLNHQPAKKSLVLWDLLMESLDFCLFSQ